MKGGHFCMKLVDEKNKIIQVNITLDKSKAPFPSHKVLVHKCKGPRWHGPILD